MSEPWKSWAIVEVMGHNEYAGFVTAETIVGAAMIRVDVPATSTLDAFTKYLASHAIYAISPCTEETARARAEAKKAVPFDSWSVEKQVIAKLTEEGRLLEPRKIAAQPMTTARSDEEEDDIDFGDDLEDDESEDDE